MTVQTNSVTANTITIGNGKTLTTNGNVAIGGNTSQGVVTNLTVTGASGTWNVSQTTSGTFQLGEALGNTNSDSVTVDLSGLGTFSADLGSGGTFQVGSNGGTSIGAISTLTLAAASTVKAGTLYVGARSGNTIVNGNANPPSCSAVALQIIQANSIVIGQDSNSGLSSGSLSFNTGTGTIQIRGYAGGSSTANLYLLTSNTGTGNAITSAFDVTGHTADLLFGTVDMMDLSGSPSANYSSTFSFDQGTLGITTLTMGTKGAATIGTGTPTVTVNIGSVNNFTNTATLGNITMANQSATGASGGLNAALNIAGTNTTASITSLTVANYTASSGAEAATGNVSISGGNVTDSGGITLANRSASGNATGTASGTLSLTGGSLTVGGDITTSGSGNSSTLISTVTLNGGTLDLGNHSIGGSGQLITNLNFQAGTLKNVAGINNGAGLVKISDGTAGNGTLVLAGANTYSGGTTLQAGTLVAGVSNVNSTSGAFGPTNGTTGLVTLGTASTNNSPVSLLNAGFTVSNPITVSSNANSGGYTIGGSNTSGTASYTGNITLNRPVTLTAASGGTVDFSTGSWTSGNNAVTVTGAGTSIVQLSNTLSTTGGVSVNSGQLNLNASTLTGNVTAAATTTAGNSGNYTGGTLGGNGTVSGTVTLSGNNTLVHGGIIAPGFNSSTVGTLTTGNQTWNGGAAYRWAITNSGNAAVGSALSGNATNDILKIGTTSSNTLTVSTSGTAFTIAPLGNLSTSITLGASKTYNWELAQIGTGNATQISVNSQTYSGNSTTPVVAGSAWSNTGAFALDTSGLSVGSSNSQYLSSSNFSLYFETIGGANELVLSYNAAPEPGAAMLVFLGGVPMLLARRRRRKPAFS